MKLSNIIFYNESWGIQNVIQKVHDISFASGIEIIHTYHVIAPVQKFFTKF